MQNNNFFNLSDFFGIKNTLDKGTKKNPIKGTTFGANKIPAQFKGATNNTEISHINKAATPLFLEISAKNSVKSQELERIRNTLNLTQGEVAELLGVSLSTIQKIEQDDIVEHRREFILRYVELNSLSNFLKNKISSPLTIKRILKTKMVNFDNKTPIEFSKGIDKSIRIYEISGILRRQLG